MKQGIERVRVVRGMSCGARAACMLDICPHLPRHCQRAGKVSDGLCVQSQPDCNFFEG